MCYRIGKAQTKPISRWALRGSEQIDLIGVMKVLHTTNRRVYKNDNGSKYFTRSLEDLPVDLPLVTEIERNT